DAVAVVLARNRTGQLVRLRLAVRHVGLEAGVASVAQRGGGDLSRGDQTRQYDEPSQLLHVIPPPFLRLRGNSCVISVTGTPGPVAAAKLSSHLDSSHNEENKRASS